MPQFTYKTTRQMEPRPGVFYSTIYYKQDSADYNLFRDWIVNVAREITAVTDADPAMHYWWYAPNKAFAKSIRSDYYSPGELLTDLLSQIVAGKDITKSMLDRWNRLCEGSPWEVTFVQASHAKRPVDPRSVSMFA